MSKRTRVLSLAFVVAASIGNGGTCSYSAALRPIVTTKDLVLDSTLLGSWTDPDDRDASVFHFERPDTSRWYRLSIVTARDTEVYRVGLARFGDALIADVFPSSDWQPHGYEFHVVPVHQIVRVWMSGESLVYESLSYHWLERMTELHRLETPHERIEIGDSRELYLLTGNTAQLQELLRRHAIDSSAFPGRTKLHRVPGGRAP